MLGHIYENIQTKLTFAHTFANSYQLILPQRASFIHAGTHQNIKKLTFAHIFAYSLQLFYHKEPHLVMLGHIYRNMKKMDFRSYFCLQLTIDFITKCLIQSCWDTYNDKQTTNLFFLVLHTCYKGWVWFPDILLGCFHFLPLFKKLLPIRWVTW